MFVRISTPELVACPEGRCYLNPADVSLLIELCAKGAGRGAIWKMLAIR